MAFVKIRAVNLQAWLRAGDKAAKEITTTRTRNKIGEFISKEFYNIEKRLFITQGGSGADGKWQKLDKKYARRKRQLGKARKILQFNRDLRASLITRGNKNISKIRGSSRGFLYEFGSRDEKAEMHYFGDGNLPVRKPINPRKQQLDRLGRRLTVFVEDGLRKVKFFDKKASRRRTGRFIRFDRLGEAQRQ